MIEVVNMAQLIDGGTGLGMDQRTSAPNRAGVLTEGYVGGHPVGISTGGFLIGSGVTDANYVGVMYNNGIIDTNVGAGIVSNSYSSTSALPTIVHRGGFKARLSRGTRHNVADAQAPFTTGVTWARANDLYLSAAGDWTNVTSSGRDTKWGKVFTAPTSSDDVMEAEFY